MSRSSNMKRKRKMRLAKGVPCERPESSLFGLSPTTYDHLLNGELAEALGPTLSNMPSLRSIRWALECPGKPFPNGGSITITGAN